MFLLIPKPKVNDQVNKQENVSMVLKIYSLMRILTQNITQTSRNSNAIYTCTCISFTPSINKPTLFRASLLSTSKTHQIILLQVWYNFVLIKSTNKSLNTMKTWKDLIIYLLYINTLCLINMRSKSLWTLLKGTTWLAFRLDMCKG